MKHKTILVCILLFVFGMVTLFAGAVTINAENEQLCNNVNTEKQNDIGNFRFPKKYVICDRAGTTRSLKHNKN